VWASEKSLLHLPVRKGSAFTIPSMHTVYGIPNCDTVKKARGWLTEHGVAHRFHDFRKEGVPAGRLDDWLSQLGWERLVNRKGTTWRRLDATAQQAVQDAASARALMVSEPSVIKRPVVDWADGRTTAGFDAADWRSRAGLA
jgi:arsenate reductase